MADIGLGAVGLNSAQSLFALFPQLVEEIDPIKNQDINPKIISAKSGKKVWWKCAKGHEWETKIEHRTRSGSGCPYCAGHRATSDNCLNSKNPELAKRMTIKPINSMKILP